MLFAFRLKNFLAGALVFCELSTVVMAYDAMHNAGCGNHFHQFLLFVSVEREEFLG